MSRRLLSHARRAPSRERGRLRCVGVIAGALMLGATAAAQAQDAASHAQDAASHGPGLRTLEPIGSQEKGLWLTDYRPGDPLFFDLDAVQFKPWAKGLFDKRQEHDLEPHARCKASGNIRQFLTPYGVEIVEIPELKRLYIFDIGGPHTYREVFMDGRSHPADLMPTNYGHNIGWWDGDTLVVDSVGYNEDSWFERYGMPYTESVHIVETFHRADAETVEYTWTVDDPATYDAPFTGRFNLYWQDGLELWEYVCQQSNYAHDLMVNPEDMISIGRTSPIAP
jgi:hypothetical protein